MTWFADAMKFLRAGEKASRAAERAIKAAQAAKGAQAPPGAPPALVLPRGYARRLVRLAAVLSERSGQHVTPSAALDLVLAMAERGAGLDGERGPPAQG